MVFFHKTPAILQMLKDENIRPVLLPASCTSLVQVLDIAINCPFNNYLKIVLEEVLFNLVDHKDDSMLEVHNLLNNGERQDSYQLIM